MQYLPTIGACFSIKKNEAKYVSKALPVVDTLLLTQKIKRNIYLSLISVFSYKI